jgi:mannose-6-phosphate isomerase
MARIYPLTFAPVFRDYIWGGRNLEALYGRALPPGIVAESWEISGHPSSPTVVDDGEWRGTPLPRLLEILGSDLVGARSWEMLARAKFPLLVKLLDAQQDLSVQVHPADAYAIANEGGELGKTEMWYVLHARPGAELIYGLAQGVTPRSFSAAIAGGTLETQLHRVPIQAGDAIYVPAGTVHALLAGAVVAEIQQNSDTTYRVYDWNRLGADGKPRPLHVEKAMQVINWGQIEPAKVTPAIIAEGEGWQMERLTRCDKFYTERLTLVAGARYEGRTDGSTFEIWGTVRGAARIAWEGGAPIAAPAVRFVLLPAALGSYSVTASTPSVLLRTYVGG